MRRLNRSIVMLTILFFVWTSAGFAGPTVAIIKHNDHKLVGESFTYEMTRIPKGEIPDKHWKPEWSKESEDAIEKMVRDAVRLTGDWPVSKGDVVAIVPNCVIDPFTLQGQGRATPAIMQCTVTDPRVVRGVALLAKESGAKKIYIATQPMSASGYSSLRSWGYGPIAKEAGAELVGLDSSEWKYFKAPHGLALKEYAIPTFMVEEVNKVISVPVMKTHTGAGYTGALKNIGIGLPTGRVYGALRYGLPHDKLARVIIDVCSIRKIDYAVVSAIWAMEGNGPTSGDPVPMDMVIGGADSVAVDAIMVEVMGFKPENYGTIRLGEQFGLGTYKGIKVLGQQVFEVARQFIPVYANRRYPGKWGEVIGWDPEGTPAGLLPGKK